MEVWHDLTYVSAELRNTVLQAVLGRARLMDEDQSGRWYFNPGKTYWCLKPGGWNRNEKWLDS